MWIVGQPRRLPGQAEPLRYKIRYCLLFVESDLFSARQNQVGRAVLCTPKGPAPTGVVALPAFVHGVGFGFGAIVF